MDGTKKVIQQTTKTITTTAQNVSPPFKKRAANAPVIPSYASSACSNSATYSSACSRVGVTSKTIILLFPKRRLFQSFIRLLLHGGLRPRELSPPPTPPKQPRQRLFSRLIPPRRSVKVVGTEVKDNIIATETKTEISTKTEAAGPLQTILLIAHDSGDPDLASLGGVGFVHL
ncbi:hypothetical protein FVER14953_03742 [Fusarium verticillioides]|nr:hypothetical protein FVER14953_03742 [Fusarium verticillioides]